MSWNRRKLLQAMSGAAATMAAASTSFPQESDDSTSRKKRRIKVAQIGVGHAHASKLSVYRKSDDYEVVGIVEPDEGLRNRANQHAAYRELKWMTQEQLLNTPGLEAVLVETRVRDSLAAAEACIDAGMHVHLDKPAGESFPHYRRIMKKAEQQGRMVQMGYMYRYNPAVVLLQDFLRKGWLGDVFEVHTVMSKVVAAGSRKSLAEYRGGMMFELGCHILDLVLGVLGKPESVTAYHQHASPIADSLEDNMLAVLAYPRAFATVKSSAMEVEGFARRHLVVCGDKGTFHIQPLDNPSAVLSLNQAHGDFKKGTQKISFPKYTRYIADAADMARVIRQEKACDFPYAHDLAVQETLLRACAMPLDA